MVWLLVCWRLEWVGMHVRFLSCTVRNVQLERAVRAVLKRCHHPIDLLSSSALCHQMYTRSFLIRIVKVIFPYIKSNIVHIISTSMIIMLVII